MAAMAASGRPSKVQVRTCLTCTNRLSDLCYDTHTLCEKCRNQVCGIDSFCDECRSWTKDFRRMFVIILLKFNLNQRSNPPPTSAVFDTGTIASVFERLHDLLDKFQGRSTPPSENLGSVRRSPTAGTSDNARPNPLTRIRPPRALIRPLDLQWLRMSSCPRS